MMTVHEVSELTGVSVRALRHYDAMGLLPPAALSPAGYRLYDDESLRRLQCILLFRVLEFPLKDIRRIMDSPGFDRNRALDQQIALLEMKREHIDNLINIAKGMRLMGVNRIEKMDFAPFDTSKIDAYAAEARASWGNSPAWQELSATRIPDSALVHKGLPAFPANKKSFCPASCRPAQPLPAN